MKPTSVTPQKAEAPSHFPRSAFRICPSMQSLSSSSSSSSSLSGDSSQNQPPLLMGIQRNSIHTSPPAANLLMNINPNDDFDLSPLSGRQSTLPSRFQIPTTFRLMQRSERQQDDFTCRDEPFCHNEMGLLDDPSSDESDDILCAESPRLVMRPSALLTTNKITPRTGSATRTDCDHGESVDIFLSASNQLFSVAKVTPPLTPRSHFDVKNQSSSFLLSPPPALPTTPCPFPDAAQGEPMPTAIFMPLF